MYSTMREFDDELLSDQNLLVKLNEQNDCVYPRSNSNESGHDALISAFALFGVNRWRRVIRSQYDD